MTGDDQIGEPADSHVYGAVFIRRGTLMAFVRALQAYEKRLREALKRVQTAGRVGALLSPQEMEKLPEAIEARRVASMVQHLAAQAQPEDREDYNPYASTFLPVSHEGVRLIKATVLAEVEALREEQARSEKSGVLSAEASRTITEKLGELAAHVSSGVFASATPATLLLAEAIPAVAGRASSAERDAAAGGVHILDGQLRARCVDLFQRFVEDGQFDRLDTVLQEGWRLLEVRLREVSGAAPGISGMDLVSWAFGGARPRIVLSELPAEQEGAHMLFRGVFGFLRNPSHHRLLGALTVERVLQQLGLIDLLLGLLEGVRRG